MTRQENRPGTDARETDTLDALGRVAGELVHDLANLVAVLDGRIRLALGDARAGRMPVAELERAAEGSADLGAMLRDVLAVLREESVSPEVVMSPMDVVERAIRRTMESCPPVEIRLASTLPPGTGVRGRASFLYRAVANLLANAARHASDRICISLERGEEGRVIVAVEDDGPGIPPEAREEVFRPLVRGPSGGTGLGLSSVAWTVAQLGGEVRCTASPILGGARFEIRLPAAAALAPRTRQPVPLTGCRVLVVDDNADVRCALGRLLRRMGAEVAELMGGTEPEEQILHTLIRSIPDVVLLDLSLGGRTGIDVWNLLREELPHLSRRVIFLSGFGPGDPLFDAARRTGQRIVTKPFDFDELSAAVEALARSR